MCVIVHHKLCRTRSPHFILQDFSRNRNVIICPNQASICRPAGRGVHFLIAVRRGVWDLSFFGPTSRLVRPVIFLDWPTHYFTEYFIFSTKMTSLSEPRLLPT